MPAPTVAEFIAEFDEYDGAPEDLIELKIAAAERRTPESIWGDLLYDGVLWLAGYLLSLDPRAREMARAAGDDSENPYLRERKRLVRIVASGYRTCGVP